MPAPSSMCAKEILPIARVARMRPARVTLTSWPLLLGRLKGRNGLGAGMRPFGARWVGLYARRAQVFDLLQTNFFKRSVFCHSVHPDLIPLPVSMPQELA